MFDDMIELLADKQETSDGQRLAQRRKHLIELIAQHYPDKQGPIVLFAPLEMDAYRFVQDSSFLYFSGISEPAVVLSFGFHLPTVLYQPNFAQLRSTWVAPANVLSDATIGLYEIDELQLSGAQPASYSIDPFFTAAEYQHVIAMLQQAISKGQVIFTVYSTQSAIYMRMKYVIDRLAMFMPNLLQHVVDISPLVTQLRRKKDISEIEKMYKAINITQGGFEAAAHVMQAGVSESSIQAAIEYIFTENLAIPAYSSIVAGGKNATILHYNRNDQTVQDGQLVLIDAGAMYEHYCADITRVYPVSGKFTKRQKELYEIVLDAQYHVQEHVRPGMYLSNAEKPDMSLQHIAIKFLKKYGYDQYYMHSIGHYLGMDVHDVGTRGQPLQENDIITIEPGIYIPEEGIGIRIEDNYWVIPDSDPVCMSENIAKTIAEVEDMVQQRFEQ